MTPRLLHWLRINGLTQFVDMSIVVAFGVWIGYLLVEWST